MLKEEAVLTAMMTTISRRVAGQIRVARYPDKPFKELMEGFRGDTLRPMGWVDGECLPSGHDYGPVWLVEYEGGLWWIKAPYQGDPEKATEDQKGWMVLCTKGLKQIFLK